MASETWPTCYKPVPDFDKKHCKRRFEPSVLDDEIRKHMTLDMKSIYTIMMDDDKHLVLRNETNIYQHEKLADRIQFLIPQKYGQLWMSDATVRFKYVDQANNARMIELELCRMMYRDYLRYVFPVDSELTKFAGDITGYLTFTFIDEVNCMTHVMYSSEITITIHPVTDYFAFVDDDSLAAIDQRLLKMDAQVKAMDVLANVIDKNGVAGRKEVRDALNKVFKQKKSKGDEDAIIASDGDVKHALDKIFDDDDVDWNSTHHHHCDEDTGDENDTEDESAEVEGEDVDENESSEDAEIATDEDVEAILDDIFG